jgi:4-amino-4-deoxy-L-arabinose transferase-like glycosyltransferase
MKLNGKGATRIAILILMWIIVTSFNISKAVHIDDTVYLEIAKHILTDPLNPMSGKVNWADSVEPIHYLNQPPILSYLFALTMKFFGESEIALHLVIALFSLGAIVFFYAVASLLDRKTAVLTTALFCLGPAFIPSQNLMTDIPMIALWITFFWAILQAPAENNVNFRYIFTATIIAVACLVKYSSLVLIPILLLDILLKKAWRHLWIIGIPIIVLVGWSFFNYHDYGGVHILSRPTPSYDLLRLKRIILAWIIGLGAVSPFSLIFIPSLFARRDGRILVCVCIFVSVLVFFLEFAHWKDTIINTYLRIGFFANGILVFSATLTLFLKKTLSQRIATPPEQTHYYFTLLTWFLGGIIFVIFFAPFIAVRHLLLVIPVVILVMVTSVIHTVKKKWIYAGMVATISLGLILGISDWTFANTYRVQANRIARSLKPQSHGTIWSVGHWGWQWYANKAGMKQYDFNDSRLEKGDFLIIAYSTHRQKINPTHWKYLKKIDEIKVDATLTTFLRTMSRQGFYYFNGYSLPWTISTRPLRKFGIFLVDKP